LAEHSERFSASLKLSDLLVEEASNREIIAVARVLALHVAHYRSRCDDIPLEESLLLMLGETGDEIRADGVEVLIDAIRAVTAPAGPQKRDLPIFDRLTKART
jgi:hypothetical protein